METQQELRKRIQNTQGLHSVVHTMKTLSAVNIRQYEKAMRSLREYYRTVSMGLSVVLRDATERIEETSAGEPEAPVAAIIYGSEQGMAGQFNRRIIEFTGHTLVQEMGLELPSVRVATLGTRIIPRLEDAGFTVEKGLSIGGSTADMAPSMIELLELIEHWRSEAGVGRILLFYNRLTSGVSFEPSVSYLLPISPDLLQEHEQQQTEWKGRTRPAYFSEWRELVSALIQQHLYVSLNRGFIESLAGENASRLSTMQAAESNIEEQLEHLKQNYNRLRQNSITQEMMDIITGFEALQD
ncbi:MAG: F0F1 ATP synthase subunit gamma [Spirochaeta sp.]